MPFAVSVAEQMHRTSQSPHSRTVLACASELLDCYMLLSLDTYNVPLGKDTCHHFCVLYASLNAEARRSDPNTKLWKMRPKIHLFQELAEYQTQYLGNPRTFWNYRDEDFVGWLAKLATTRGGARGAAAAAAGVMNRYRTFGALRS